MMTTDEVCELIADAADAVVSGNDTGVVQVFEALRRNGRWSFAWDVINDLHRQASEFAIERRR
jgi:hypothetical protein